MISDAFYLFWLLEEKRKLWGYLYQCHMFDLLYKTVRRFTCYDSFRYFNCRNPLSQTSLVVQWFSLHDSTAESADSSPVGESTSFLLSGMVKIKREKKPTFQKHCSVLSLRMFLENDCLHKVQHCPICEVFNYPEARQCIDPNTEWVLMVPGGQMVWRRWRHQLRQIPLLDIV